MIRGCKMGWKLTGLNLKRGTFMIDYIRCYFRSIVPNSERLYLISTSGLQFLRISQTVNFLCFLRCHLSPVPTVFVAVFLSYFVPIIYSWKACTRASALVQLIEQPLKQTVFFLWKCDLNCQNT